MNVIDTTAMLHTGSMKKCKMNGVACCRREGQEYRRVDLHPVEKMNKEEQKQIITG